MKLIDNAKVLLYRLFDFKYDARTREIGRRYKAHLETLLHLAEERMLFQPICPFCNTRMMLRRSVLVNAVPMRDDQDWKCPRCKYVAHFGTPLTRKEYKEELDLRGGRMLMTPTYRQDERNNPEVLKRLKRLGYID